ncbi:hypothetical protein CP02DC14_1324, partial [Chlamydia psittaci 02DC14]
LDWLKPDSNRTRPAQTGFVQLKPDSNRTRQAQTGLNVSNRTQTGSDRLKQEQTG